MCNGGEGSVSKTKGSVKNIAGEGGELHLNKLDNLDEQIPKKTQEQVKMK